ncbi:MAG: hypothetical protein KKA79_10550, partial [Nanoarchaeota archaeon]|nr:hypothetical protein [Nanoarchaeota archaeon]
MKLPKTFRKENLDEKTAKLAEQANITKKAEAIYPQELKDFIKKYCKEDKKSDTEILHAAVDNLLAQTDYLPKGEDETFEHWIRDDPKNIEGKYVLTRNNLDRNRGRYIFAKVNNKNLETYISTVEEKLNNETEF